MGSLSGGGLRALLRLRSECLRHCCSMVDWNPADFRPKKAVVLTKVSRYEFEKMQHEKLSETELEEMLTKAMRDSLTCVSFQLVLGMRIRIRMILGLPDPDPDPLFRGAAFPFLIIVLSGLK
jgi:hypothetical protein